MSGCFLFARISSMNFDINLFNFIFGLGQKIGLNWLYEFLATYLIYVVVVVFSFFLLKEKDLRKKVFVFLFSLLLLVISRGLVTEIIRFIFPKQRPFAQLDFVPLVSNSGLINSMPSGHTVFVFSLAFCVFLLNKKWGWICVGLAFLVSLGRILVGVHWPMDVLVGVLISGVSYWGLKKVTYNLQFTVNDRITI